MLKDRCLSFPPSRPSAGSGNDQQNSTALFGRHSLGQSLTPRERRIVCGWMIVAQEPQGGEERSRGDHLYDPAAKRHGLTVTRPFIAIFISTSCAAIHAARQPSRLTATGERRCSMVHSYLFLGRPRDMCQGLAEIRFMQTLT